MKIFTSFQSKLTLILILSMCLVAALSNVMIYKLSLKSQVEQLRNNIMILAQTIALSIDAQQLTAVPLNKEGVNSPEFKAIYEKLEAFKKINPAIKYIYTMGKTNQPGIFQYLVDPEALRKDETGLSAFPGEKYDASRFEEMLKAFDGPSADKKIEVDEWGATLSGYAPVRNNSGEAVAMLGIDISADNIYLLEQKIKLRLFLVLGFGIILSLILGIVFSRRISKPINKLAQATHLIAEGKLDYKVDIKGSDEIAGLAANFNTMTESLSESRAKLQTYFYRIVQSLVKALEARDQYTSGHSERVADYAVKIAWELGFTPERIEVLKEAAELHDIGKLGIRDNVLNKTSDLNDEEWKLIKEHPVIGEDILKPVFLTQDFIDVIRSHHERYDGTGYPDRLKADQINLLAQIITVADSYDAMTSSRAYRPALSKEVAINEIKKKSGSQFNPKIVDAFLKAISSS